MVLGLDILVALDNHCKFVSKLKNLSSMVLTLKFNR